MTEVTKVFPKASELNTILNHLECPEKECTEVFQNTPNLTLHLLKTHGKEQTLKSSTYGCKIAEYYCPEIGCKYCFNPEFDDTREGKKFSNRYFTQFKYLKQHYIKVHLAKTYICDKCNKGFPTDLHRLRHYEVCGIKYVCSCGTEYSLLASLQTHARREQHSYSVENMKAQTRSRRSSSTLNEAQNSIHNNNNNVDCDIEVTYKNFHNNVTNSGCGSNLLILPKGTSIVLLHGMIEPNKKIDNICLQNTSVSTQTDIPKRRKNLSPVKGLLDKPMKKRTSIQTQTGEKRPKKNTETQTSFHYLTSEDKRKNTKNSSSTCTTGRKRKKSMETQTHIGSNNDNDSISISSNNNNSYCHKNNNSFNEYEYSLSRPSSLIGTGIALSKSDEESNFEDTRSISQQDICLPQLWLNSESESVIKDNVCLAYSTNLNSSVVKCSEVVSSLPFDCVKKTDENSLLYNENPAFGKGPIKESNSCHIETQTDSAINSLIDDYLNNCDNGIPGDDSLDQYNRWTQTCDDIVLPDDIALDFTNNETQTAWSLNGDSFISDVVNSETQTPLLNIDDYILGTK